MKNYNIYYVVETIMPVDKGLKKQKPQKETKIFALDSPLKLRIRAFNYFKRKRDEYHVKRQKLNLFNERSKQTYHTDPFLCLAEETDVSIYTKGQLFNLEVTISFVIVKNDIFEPSNEELLPIGAIGNNLKKVEDLLKINLLIEYEYYSQNHIRIAYAKRFKNFVKQKHLFNYMVNNFDYYANENEFIYIKTIRDIIKHKRQNYIETPQFYTSDNTQNKYKNNTSVEDYLRISKMNKINFKLEKVSKEISSLLNYYNLVNEEKIDDLTLENSEQLFDKISEYKYLITKKQEKILQKTAVLIKKSPFNIKASIRKWL